MTRARVLVATLVLLLTLPGAARPAGAQTVLPPPWERLYWQEKVAAFRAVQPRVAPGGIVFLGDSITAGYPVTELYPGRPVLNRGISGDTVRGLIRRLDGSVLGLRAAVVLVMIGVNDLKVDPNPTILDNYRALVAAIRTGSPATRIVLQSILPTRGRPERPNQRIVELNRGIRAIAEEQATPYLDLHALCVDGAGELREGVADDGLHPGLRGEFHARWTAAVTRLLERLGM